ncbi:Rhythmically expressed gene 5 protein, partial [Pseudolycoriella hygida]
MTHYLNIVITMSLVLSCSGSAIPMWEFLSRGEKMSHLYSMFAKQVSSYCKTNIDASAAKCKRDLLVYGVDKLERMTDLHLDAMDPYQRGANDIIWDSMMEGHRSSSSKKQESTPSPIREPTGPYEKNPLFDDDNSNDYTQNQAASSSIPSFA